MSRIVKENATEVSSDFKGQKEMAEDQREPTEGNTQYCHLCNPPKHIPSWQRHRMGHSDSTGCNASVTALHTAPNVRSSFLLITFKDLTVNSSRFKASIHVSIYCNSSTKFLPKDKHFYFFKS